MVLKRYLEKKKLQKDEISSMSTLHFSDLSFLLSRFHYRMTWCIWVLAVHFKNRLFFFFPLLDEYLNPVIFDRWLLGYSHSNWFEKWVWHSSRQYSTGRPSCNSKWNHTSCLSMSTNSVAVCVIVIAVFEVRELQSREQEDITNAHWKEN